MWERHRFIAHHRTAHRSDLEMSETHAKSDRDALRCSHDIPATQAVRTADGHADPATRRSALEALSQPDRLSFDTASIGVHIWLPRSASIACR
uniref:Uncharacterized protein n=1 Tax=Ralstonia syzygii R24 TaxID=907261 RepID=G3ABU9_9RALS|nr:hypothetical protein RALSY_mp30325 [Ralstonia syzygii R24]